MMSEYDQSTLIFVREWKCDPSLVNSNPEDYLFGYGAVEIVLNSLLAG